VPYLIRAVEWNPSGLDRLGGVAWRHTGWLARRLDLPHPEVTRSRENSKRGVMYVLARLGPLAKDALPALREVGRDSDWNNRTFAFSAIAGIGPEEKDIPLLIRALADKQRNVRIQAARGLGNLGLPSKDAIGALRNSLHDEDEAVRKIVSAALMKIDPQAATEQNSK
jgi:HEAT repeat protein